MVRIRKKTSNRSTTAHRAKIKHKARETRKKAKKEAKKNPHLHKKKKKKDPGIPNSFPFKEQILTEVAAARRQALEEKQQKSKSKQLDSQETLPESASQAIKLIKDQNQKHGNDTMEIDDDAPPLIDTTIPDTAAAIQAADVVLYVLDARDPLSYRSSFVEKILGDRTLFFILNKIDLAPRESVKSWLPFLRKIAPTLPFRSASRQIPVDALSTKDGKKVQPQDDDAWGLDALMKALKGIKPKKGDLTVTLVGMTNVGKSAIINSILKKSTFQVYGPLLKHSQNSPSTTPHPQAVVIAQKKLSYRFIDTPGLSFIPPSEPSTDEEVETRIARDVLLRNRGNISKINDPLPAALYILSRAVIEDVMMLYNLPAVQADDYHAVLASLARKEGALQKKGAIVDFQGAARALVRDWKTGRLAFYSMPPSEGSSGAADTLKPSDSALVRIYEEIDDQVLSQVSSRKELRRSKGAIVQLKGATIDTRKADLEANVMLSDDESDDEAVAYSNYPSKGDLTDGSDDDSEGDEGMDEGEDDEGEDDEEISPDEQYSGLEDEDDVSDMEPSPPPKLSRKQQKVANRADPDDGKSKAARSSISTSKKSVSFVPYTKAGAKIKKQASASQAQSGSKSKFEPIQKAKSAPIKGSKPGNITATNKSTNQVEGDDYDFSRYF